MEKLSVKKPFTILVAVVLVIVLGVVSITSMTTDLLPNMSLPYLMVVTTYPGASPERVENDVVRPLESALGTVSGVQNVYSTSSENYGMIQLEFADGTDMESTLVKVNSALQEVSASLPELCGTPSVIEISMDMMATMYVSVSREGYDIYELSNFVDNTVRPYLERQPGVANVTSIGLVEQHVQVELDKDKISELNIKILATVNDQLAKAKEELEKAEVEVTAGIEALDKAQAAFGETMADSIFSQLEGPVTQTAAELKGKVDALLVKVTALRAELTGGETGQLLDSIIQELKTISSVLESEEMKAEDVLLAAGSLRVLAKNLSAMLSKLEQPAPGESRTGLASLRQALLEAESALTELSKLLDSVPELLSGLESAFAGIVQAQLEAAVSFSTARNQLTAAQAQLATAKQQYETAKEDAPIFWSAVATATAP